MFAQRLKDLRKSRPGLTQAKLAEILDVSQQAVGLWERGKNMPSHELVFKIASFFNVTTDYLLGRDTPSSPAPDSKATTAGHQEVAEVAAHVGMATTVSGRKTIGAEPPQKKEYIELHRLIDQLPHDDVEELLNTARYKKNKAEKIREHVDDPDDF